MQQIERAPVYFAPKDHQRWDRGREKYLNAFGPESIWQVSAWQSDIQYFLICGSEIDNVPSLSRDRISIGLIVERCVKRNRKLFLDKEFRRECIKKAQQGFIKDMRPPDDDETRMRKMIAREDEWDRKRAAWKAQNEKEHARCVKAANKAIAELRERRTLDGKPVYFGACEIARVAGIARGTVARLLKMGAVVLCATGVLSSEVSLEAPGLSNKESNTVSQPRAQQDAKQEQNNVEQSQRIADLDKKMSDQEWFTGAKDIIAGLARIGRELLWCREHGETASASQVSIAAGKIVCELPAKYRLPAPPPRTYSARSEQTRAITKAAIDQRFKDTIDACRNKLARPPAPAAPAEPATTVEAPPHSRTIDGWATVIKNGRTYQIPVMQGQTVAQAQWAARKQRPHCKDLPRMPDDS